VWHFREFEVPDRDILDGHCRGFESLTASQGSLEPSMAIVEVWTIIVSHKNIFCVS
jgi:hypothetical protein